MVRGLGGLAALGLEGAAMLRRPFVKVWLCRGAWRRRASFRVVRADWRVLVPAVVSHWCGLRTEGPGVELDLGNLESAPAGLHRSR